MANGITINGNGKRLTAGTVVAIIGIVITISGIIYTFGSKLTGIEMGADATATIATDNKTKVEEALRNTAEMKGEINSINIKIDFILGKYGTIYNPDTKKFESIK